MSITNYDQNTTDFTINLLRKEIILRDQKLNDAIEHIDNWIKCIDFNKENQTSIDLAVKDSLLELKEILSKDSDDR